jgi:hypothetical protein
VLGGGAAGAAGGAAASDTSGFGATASGMAGFGGAASGPLAGAAAAACFFGDALVNVLAVGLRTGDLATFVLVARAFVRGARFEATVFADFRVVFFTVAIFVFFDFFAIFVS